MHSVFKKFYKDTYLKTGGFIPINPLRANVHPGDMFQIKNGEMIFLGSIFNPQIIDSFEVDFEKDIKLNPVSWTFGSGVTKPYSGRGAFDGGDMGAESYSRQILAFAERGSFVFKGTDPTSIRIANWNQIRNELILKLTQTYYSFREIYVVTECALPSTWTLAIAGAEKAELEIGTSTESNGFLDLFGEKSSKTIQSKDLEYYEFEPHRKSAFFKAKKLIVRNEKTDIFLSDLISTRRGHQNWARSYFSHDFYIEDGFFVESSLVNEQASILDFLNSTQLNPNTVLEYFDWANTSLDDIESLFACND